MSFDLSLGAIILTMTINNAEQILVVILSTTLGIFLILGIIALVKINQILGHVNNITQKAEKIADQAQHVGEFFQKGASSAAVVKLVSNLVNSIKDSKTGKERE